MKDELVLEALLDVLDETDHVIDEALVRRVLEVAVEHRFASDRSFAKEQLLRLVTDFVELKIREEKP